MPKKLNISSNERVDLVDFNRASAEYTQESDNFGRQQLLQSKRSLVVAGFRIEVSNQATNPGEFTLYNGTAIDRPGNLLNNEQQVNDSRTLTLSGANTDFYIEVEFVEEESDVDSRAFWDPTFSGNTPPGKEFSLNVATRLSPDWQIVNPVGTSDFDANTNVNSAKVPIAVLHTNVSNEIIGFTAVNIATVLEEDAGAADLELRVLDSSLFPTTGTATVGGTAVTITGNDRTNGILTIAPAMGLAKEAGDIVVQTGVTAAWLPMDDDAVPAAPGASTSADQRRSLFKGDEIRGSALSTNPEDAASRSDLQLQSLKDHVDFLAAQLREMKFGTLRSDGNSALPPTSFTNTRYFDAAGSITGAKSYVITIGDGVSSFGDLNAASNNLGTIIDQAHNALDATDGGEILVRIGSYVWDATVEVDRPLKITFEEGVVFAAGTYAASPLALKTSELVEVVNMPPVPSTELPFPVIPVDGSFEAWDPNFKAVNSHVNIDWSANGDPLLNRIVLHDCTLVATSGNPAIKGSAGAAGAFELLEFKNCSISYVDVADSSVGLVDDIQLHNCTFENCIFDLTASTGSAAEFIDTANANDLRIEGCKFLSDSGGQALSPINFAINSDGPVVIKDCVFDFYFDSGTATQEQRSVIYSRAPDVTVEGCDFSAIADNGIPSTTAVDPATILYLRDGGTHYIKNNFFGHRSSINDTINDYTRHVYVDAGVAHIVDNEFNHFWKAIEFDSASDGYVRGNEFRQTTTSDPLRDSTAVHWDSTGSLSVVENKYDQESGGADTADLMSFVNLFDTTQAPIISNNQAVMESAAAQLAFIRFDTSAATDKALRLLASNNSVEMEASGSNNAKCVWVATSTSQPFSDIRFTDNRAFLVHSGTAGALAGVDMSTGLSITSENPYGTRISGNMFYLSGPSAVSADSVQVQGNNTIISENTIVQTGKSTGTTGNGIRTEGHKVIISNNTISFDADGYAECILAEGVSISSNTPNGQITITGNMVFQMSEAPAITVENQFDENENIVISNNNIVCDTSTTYTGTKAILVDATGITKNVVISNNNIVELTVTTASETHVIACIADLTSNDFTSVVISGNNISGENTSLTRPIQSSAILVDNAEFVSIMGNIIRGWVGTGDNQTSIETLSCDQMCVTGNNVEYSGTSGEDCIILAGVDAQASGNIMANAGVYALDTAACTGVVVINGDNLTA